MTLELPLRRKSLAALRAFVIVRFSFVEITLVWVLSKVKRNSQSGEMEPGDLCQILLSLNFVLWWRDRGWWRVGFRTKTWPSTIMSWEVMESLLREEYDWDIIMNNTSNKHRSHDQQSSDKSSRTRNTCCVHCYILTEREKSMRGLCFLHGVAAIQIKRDQKWLLEALNKITKLWFWQFETVKSNTKLTRNVTNHLKWINRRLQTRICRAESSMEGARVSLWTVLKWRRKFETTLNALSHMSHM